MKYKFILFAFALSLFAPLVSVQAATDHLVISQIQVSGDGGANDEFVEIHNPTASAISLDGWSLQYKSSTGDFPLTGGKRNLPDVSVAAGGFFLVGNNGYDGTVAADFSHSSFSMSGNAAGGTVFLVNTSDFLTTGTDAAIVDKVGYGNAETNSPETANAALPESENSIIRSGDDTDDNSADFSVAASDPRNGGATGNDDDDDTDTGDDDDNNNDDDTNDDDNQQQPVDEFDLVVTLSATGTGKITSTPSGINCGTDCAHKYDDNTVVQLLATPASDSEFAGWTGDCTGLGSCSVTMNELRVVTATFTDKVVDNGDDNNDDGNDDGNNDDTGDDNDQDEDTDDDSSDNEEEDCNSPTIIINNYIQHPGGNNPGLGNKSDDQDRPGKAKGVKQRWHNKKWGSQQDSFQPASYRERYERSSFENHWEQRQSTSRERVSFARSWR